MGKTKFQSEWQTRGDFKEWLRPAVDPYRANCNVCKTDFDIKTMGLSAVKSHSIGKKHVKKLKQRKGTVENISSFLKQSRTEEVNVSGSEKSTSDININCDDEKDRPSTSTRPITVSTDERWTAEIIWAMKVVFSHFSYKSCTDIEKLFRKMFPDSQIAKEFTCGASKCAYIVCYGLAPYFRSQLLDQIRGVNAFVILLDESMNKYTQKKQMDYHIRFYDESSKEVVTRYFTSDFLGHAYADTMVSSFLENCGTINLNKLIQVSMDGPTVNWSFYDKLMTEIGVSTSDKHLIDIGSCGLHIVHNAFQTGFEATTWNIKSFLTALYYLFHDTPARRDDFTQITSSNVFPLKFCAHRWVENVNVANRALIVFDNVRKYVDTIEKQPKKYTVPKSKSYENVKEAVLDVLMPVKLTFFESVAKEYNEFLVKFQCDKPMSMFLHRDLDRLVRNQMRRFIKKETLESLSTSQMIMLDLNEKNQVTHNKVDLGFAATRRLKELIFNKRVSELQVMNIKMESLKCLTVATKKLQSKCPLKYSMTRNLSCLDPRMMEGNKTDCKAKFDRVLHKLVDLKQLNESDCDKVKYQYEDFLDNIMARNCSHFKEFQDERIDTFLGNYLIENKLYKEMWHVVKKLLIISHGQATVERGFSINSELIVENMAEKSVVAQRQVYDGISHYGAPETV